VIADDLMQDAPGGIAPQVLDRGRGHGADGGGWRASGTAAQTRRLSA
jgi:hypothetical protein